MKWRGRTRSRHFAKSNMLLRPLLSILLWLTPTAVYGQQIGLSTGGGYSSGRYGGDQIVEVGSTWLGADVTALGWRLDATLPYLLIDIGDTPVEVGGMVLPGGGKVRGIGDATLRLTGPAIALKPVNITLSGHIKLPTGAEAVSTGKLDAGADVEVSRDLGSLSPFLSIGYRTYGDSSLLHLSNGWAASVGSALTVRRTTFVGAYHWSQSATGGPAAEEISSIAAGDLSERWGWLFFGSKGLSSGAPAFSAGAGVRLNLGKQAVGRTKRMPR